MLWLQCVTSCGANRLFMCPVSTGPSQNCPGQSSTALQWRCAIQPDGQSPAENVGQPLTCHAIILHHSPRRPHGCPPQLVSFFAQEVFPCLLTKIRHSLAAFLKRASTRTNRASSTS